VERVAKSRVDRSSRSNIAVSRSFSSIRSISGSNEKLMMISRISGFCINRFVFVNFLFSPNALESWILVSFERTLNIIALYRIVLLLLLVPLMPFVRLVFGLPLNRTTPRIPSLAAMDAYRAALYRYRTVSVACVC